jgi:hypothetical protein
MNCWKFERVPTNYGGETVALLPEKKRSSTKKKKKNISTSDEKSPRENTLTGAALIPTNRITLFLFGFLHGGARGPPLLQLRRRDQSRRAGGVVLPRLPPVVVVLADDLKAKNARSTHSGGTGGVALTWRMSPVLKAMPACAQGISSSSRGS